MTKHEQELKELISFFETAKFPKGPFRLNKYMTLGDNPELFVAGEVNRIKSYHGSVVVLESLFRHLRELKEICLKE